MDIEKGWNQALRKTEIIRARVQGLMANSDTIVPYIFLSESEVNVGDTTVRKGEIIVTKPSLIIPPNNPQFYGFEFNAPHESIDENSFINFLLVRGLTLPSLRYDNVTSVLDIYEGKLGQAVKYYNSLLQKEENVKTGLLTGPGQYWQFSVIIFICSQIARNAEQDINRLLQDYKRKMEGNS
ncbi:MAG: hypothetical protein HQL27_04105 [Candidatus Omnitrophica bacterium]|nr:hypothetical protein [Candidatus Omnitrophota bacterium]